MNRRFSWFRAVTLAIALFCAIFNVSVIYLSASNLRETAEVFPNLVRNSKYYGREISPDVIASLHNPAGVQISEAVFIIAAVLGLLLALYLFIAALKLNKDPVRALRNIEHFQRWKVVGACFTAAAFGWSLHERQQFWSEATRHGSRGWPPAFEAAVLFAFAMIPVWWVTRGIHMKM